MSTQCIANWVRTATTALIGWAVLQPAAAGAEPADPPPPSGRRWRSDDDRAREGQDDRRRPRRDHRRERFGRAEREEFNEVPVEDVERFLEVLRDRIPPEKYERLLRLRDDSPDRFRQLIQRRMEPAIREFLELRRESPALAESVLAEFDAQGRLHELSDAYRRSEDPAKRQEIEKEIGVLARKQIEFTRQRQEFRLRQFAQRLDEQKRRFEEEKARFEADADRLPDVVARRVEEIKQGRVAPPGMMLGPPPPGEGRPGDRRGPRGLFGDDDEGRRGPGEGPRFRDDRRHRGRRPPPPDDDFEDDPNDDRGD